jgi:DNA primase
VCDIGGDVFSFVMKMEGVEFREALQILAERAGIAIEKTLPHPVAPGEFVSGNAAPAATGMSGKRTLLHTMAWAEKQYHECLLNSPEADVARRYLQERGITAESIERFALGFSPLGYDWIARQAAVNVAPEKHRHRVKLLERVGILARSNEGGGIYDRFRGRVLFSIHDGQGRPVGMGGRVLPELGSKSPAKYVNSPETPLFTKSKLLYGMDLAREAFRKTHTALVMEGYTDVIVAHQYGFSNAVAALGTAVGESHIRLLKAHVDRIVLVLDGDEAGTRRANEVLEMFVAQQADLRILTLPEDLDPCDYLHKYGAEAFEHLLANEAVDALDHAFATKTRNLDLEHDIHGASEALEELVSIVAKAPRLQHDTTHDIRFREEKILQRLAARFRVSEREVRERLTALRRHAASRPSMSRQADADASVGEPQRHLSADLDIWQRAFLELLVAVPECLPALREAITPEHLTAEVCRQVFETCCRLSDEGAIPSFDRLMLEYDEPEIKSLLVGLDESWHAKGRAASDAEALVEDLVRTWTRKEVEKQRPAQIVALREGGLDELQQAQLLEDILRQERNRQGISKPTDG